MHLFRFSNKSELKNQKIVYVIYAILGSIIMFLYFHYGVSFLGLLFLILTIISVGYVQFFQSKYKYTIEQLAIEEDKFTISFFHKMKDAIVISSEKISFKIVSSEKIEILNKENSKVIGIAEKKYAVDSNTLGEFEDYCSKKNCGNVHSCT